MMLLAYLGLFSATPCLNAGSIKQNQGCLFDIDALAYGFGQINESVKHSLQVWGKSCLKRVNPEVSGTEEKPQKSLNSRENLRKMISRETAGIEKISCNRRALSIEKRE